MTMPPPPRHEFYPHPMGPNTSMRCYHTFTHRGKEVQCGQPRMHEWHHLTHCTKCDDTGIIWVQRFGNSYWPLHCPTCEEGQNMEEFL